MPWRQSATGDNRSVPAILFSFAHPDDESFSGAGTAMRYAAQGIPSILVTATRGERGQAGQPPICASEDIGACRERELRAAAQIIGFEALHLLDYRDRELADAPPDEIRRSLVSVIRRWRPEVTLTLDPNGFNLHPDHVAISRFTSDALSVAADARWHPELGDGHMVQRLLWTPPFPPWDAVAAPGLDARFGADFIIDVSLYRQRRAAALRAHRTQHVSIDKYFFQQPDPRRILDSEIWRQAWGPPLTTRPSRDIMEGVVISGHRETGSRLQELQGFQGGQGPRKQP
jgi:LmbE family N-acetylglucosaminyl deacetylase